jgi:hypothetical protein
VPTDGFELFAIIIIIEVAAAVSGATKEDTEHDADDCSDEFVGSTPFQLATSSRDDPKVSL